MGKRALVVVDMIQTYDFEDADALRRNVEQIIEPLERVLQAAKDADVLRIYVNDSSGSWLSEREKLVGTALEGEFANLVESIQPDDEALFIVKARHSIFYGTPLETVLHEEGIEELVLAGQVTEQCILYSALDAHIRHIPTTIVRDAVASIHPDLAEAALTMMERNMGAELVAAADLRFDG